MTTRYAHMYIGGEWVPPTGGTYFLSENPARGEMWAEIPEAGEADVDRAVQAARKAFKSPEWSGMTPSDRGHLLRRIAEAVRKRAETIARCDTTDNGKVYRDSLAEVEMTWHWFHYFAGMADKIQGDYLPLTGEQWTYTIREPVGVVGAILPWNSPTLLASWKLAPALAAGCTVVLKPAEQTSAGALELAGALEEAGVPPGVVNVVTGYGETTGAALVRHPDVDKIAFTGSTETAREITRMSAVNLTKLQFELGGKSPNIIFEDADFDQALYASLSGMFVNSGQQCSVCSRIFIHESMFDRYAEQFVAYAKRIRVGDPMDPGTHMGAIVSREQLDKIERYVDMARKEGGAILCGGTRPTDPALQRGYFFNPTVITNMSPESPVCQEEIFGPVTVLFPFKDEDEAVALANDCGYGLVAGVWTDDVRRAHRVARKLEAGLVWINNYRQHHWTQPYGGVKMSGYGREGGFEVIREYTHVKAIQVDMRTERPAPYRD